MNSSAAQVCIPVAYTCSHCEGSEFYTYEGQMFHCPDCQRGLITALVPLRDVLALCSDLSPAAFYDATVALAVACAAKQPALTHNTANVPVGQLPTRRRIPLQPPKPVVAPV